MYKPLNVLLTSLVLMFTSQKSSNAEPLKYHIWNNRVILSKFDKTLNESCKSLKNEIVERDIIYYFFDEKNALKATNAPKSITEKEIQKIKNIYQSYKKRTLLIGKDGGVKFKADKLNFTKIFALIDSMPMRKREIKQQNANKK